LKNRYSKEAFLDGILKGDRQVLSKAITLTESTLNEDIVLAEEIINELDNAFGNSIRIGITGSPGVGKSTLIEALGNAFTALGKKVAVLAIDPSSPINKGSILGDKTRMESLSNNPLAFIRPSPSNLYLGGTSAASREAMLLCDAAGFEIILIETVGVGQSETEVKNMVDFFLLLILAGSGDELQGIKKGIIEMADAILITKADGDNIQNAENAKKEYENAIHYSANSTIEIATFSAFESGNITSLIKLIFAKIENNKKNGAFQINRQNQKINWFRELLNKTLLHNFYKEPENLKNLKITELQLSKGIISPGEAVKKLINK
jgi:LAO/AO transport system kinase